MQMADGIPEYLQTATQVKTRKPRKRVVKKPVVAKSDAPLESSATPITPSVPAQEPSVSTHVQKASVSLPTSTPIASTPVEVPASVTVVDATLEELKEAMRKKIWTPSADTFFGVDIVAKNKAAGHLV